MANSNSSQRKYLLFLLPLIAIVVLVIIKNIKPAPNTALKSLSTPVNVLVLKKELIAPAVIGYGRVIPKLTWDAISEVSGRVIYRHPDLLKGKTLLKDTLILKVDPTDYKLALTKAASKVSLVNAELARIALNGKQNKALLKIESKRYELQKIAFERQQKLFARKAVSRSSVDSQQSILLAQEQKLLELKTLVNRFAQDINIAKENIVNANTQLKEADRLLKKTNIHLPFNTTITQVNAALEQVISSREVLVKTGKMDVLEVFAQFSISDLRQLIAQIPIEKLSRVNGMPDIAPLKLQAEIKLFSNDTEFSWPGVVTRVSDSINRQGNSMTLIIEAQQSEQLLSIKSKPPLITDMFVQVTVLGPKTPLIVIPNKALHGTQVYLEDEGKLVRKSVTSSLSYQDKVIILDLAEGLNLITSDLSPAIPDMPVHILDKIQ